MKKIIIPLLIVLNILAVYQSNAQIQRNRDFKSAKERGTDVIEYINIMDINWDKALLAYQVVYKLQKTIDPNTKKLKNPCNCNYKDWQDNPYSGVYYAVYDLNKGKELKRFYVLKSAYEPKDCSNMDKANENALAFLNYTKPLGLKIVWNQFVPFVFMNRDFSDNYGKVDDLNFSFGYKNMVSNGTNYTSGSVKVNGNDIFEVKQFEEQSNDGKGDFLFERVYGKYDKYLVLYEYFWQDDKGSPKLQVVDFSPVFDKKALNNQTSEVKQNTNGIIGKYRYLSQIFSEKDEFYPELVKYFKKINGEVTSEKQIAEIFDLRNLLLKYATEKTEDFYYGKGENSPVLWEKAEKELISVGFMPVYGEGMFSYLDKALILKDAINKYASEAFKLKLFFEEEYAKNSGGEYPYSALEDQFEAFNYAYKLYSNYSDTKYYKEIKNDFRSLLLDFVDLHKVGEMCYAGNLYFADYPWMADCDLPLKFQEKFPDNKFTFLFEKLQNNMSEFNPQLSVYLIVVEELNTQMRKDEGYMNYEQRIVDEKLNKLFNYWENGIDVVHSVKITDLKTEYLVYRFYSDKNKALSELKKIKKFIPSARIVKASVDENQDVIIAE